jgi:hypothetical protein
MVNITEKIKEYVEELGAVLFHKSLTMLQD